MVRNSPTLNRDEIQSRIDQLRTAESGEQWAEIAYLEALLNGGPWYSNDAFEGRAA
jgi:hypothetical protein